jgi:outer membrane lipoprotein-sorting protein
MAAAPLRIVALLAALPLVLSACGQTSKDSAKDFQGEQRAVAQAVEDLQSASSKSNEDKICTQLLAPTLVAKIKSASKGTCQSALKDALGDADTFELQVKKVVVNGNTATATVTSDAGGNKDRADTLQLVKDGGRWKIATLGNAA